jgi:hypothetical protein
MSAAAAKTIHPASAMGLRGVKSYGGRRSLNRGPHANVVELAPQTSCLSWILMLWMLRGFGFSFGFRFSNFRVSQGCDFGLGRKTFEPSLDMLLTKRAEWE